MGHYIVVFSRANPTPGGGDDVLVAEDDSAFLAEDGDNILLEEGDA